MQPIPNDIKPVWLDGIPFCALSDVCPYFRYATDSNELNYCKIENERDDNEKYNAVQPLNKSLITQETD